MKKLITLLLLTVAYTANAQYIKVTPEGLKDAKEEQSYVVLDFENQSAEDLYGKSVLFVNQRFKSPEHVIKSNVANKMLRYSDYKPNGIQVLNGIARIPVDVNYQVELGFKDNKVKFDIVSLDMSTFTFKGNVWNSLPIWNEKNGKLRLEQEKNELEEYFNAIVVEYVEYMNGNTQDDW